MRSNNELKIEDFMLDEDDLRAWGAQATMVRKEIDLMEEMLREPEEEP